MSYLWPACCPCCGSRKVFVLQQSGAWFCSGCDVDSADVTDGSVNTVRLPAAAAPSDKV